MDGRLSDNKMYSSRAPSRASHSGHSSVKPIPKKGPTFSGVGVDIQEALVLEDLLFVLMGIPGTYISFHPDYSPDESSFEGAKFTIISSLDPSLMDLVERIIPIATYYTAISSFIEVRGQLDFGLVNHALCAAIRDMLKDYLTLVSQLEHAFTSSSTFTLQKLLFYIQPTLHTLSLVYSLITELAHVEKPTDGDSDESSEDEETARKNEELGLGPSIKILKEVQLGAGGIVKGGEVVGILWERMMNMSGDPAAHQLYRDLLLHASRPYTQMLERWATKGHLHDPYDEFMVKENKFINRGTLEMDYTDEYWDRRYTLRDGSNLTIPSKRQQAGVPPPRTPGGRLPGGACIPPSLEVWKQKILLAGKYLNVIRECGIEVQHPQESNNDPWGLDDDKFYRAIEDAYTYANRTLLKLLLNDEELVPRLRSLKQYFFLSQSSFLTHFLDLSQTELKKPAKGASLSKLQSLLDISLTEVGFGFREDVKVVLASTNLYDWLFKVLSVSGTLPGPEETEGGAWPAVGFEEVERKTKSVDKEKEKAKEKEKDRLAAVDVLSLEYGVKFPLSLVISRRTILRYQLIFRFLLHLKHVEQLLCSTWIDHKSPAWRTPLPSHPDMEQWRSRVFLLRARMLAYVQQIIAYATFDVLEPNWRNLEAKLAKVQTVDQLLRDHIDFLDTCSKECMLTNAKMLRIYSKLVHTCFTFVQYSPQFTRSANQVLSALNESGGDPTSAPMEKRWDFLEKFEKNFHHFFAIHLDTVQYFASSENVTLLALVVRLNQIRVPTFSTS